MAKTAPTTNTAPIPGIPNPAAFTDVDVPTETRSSKYETGVWADALTSIPDGKARSFTFPLTTKEEHEAADKVGNVLRATALAVRPSKTLRIKRSIINGKSVTFVVWWTDKVRRPRKSDD